MVLWFLQSGVRPKLNYFHFEKDVFFTLRAGVRAFRRRGGIIFSSPRQKSGRAPGGYTQPEKQMYYFEVNPAAPEDRLAKHLAFKEMRQFSVDTPDGKSMKFNRIPIYARNPKTRNQQDALLRLPQQLISAAYGDVNGSKIRAGVDIVQQSDEVDRCFAELAEATLPILQKVGPAINRKLSASDIDGLRLKACGESGAFKLYVDIHRHGFGGRRASRFYNDTDDMTDVSFAQLFCNSDGEPAPKRRRAGGDGRDDDGSMISITPFKCEILLNIESVLIGPQSLRFVMSIVEGVVPSDVGIQYSLLRQGKIWGPKQQPHEPAEEIVAVPETTEPAAAPLAVPSLIDEEPPAE